MATPQSDQKHPISTIFEEEEDEANCLLDQAEEHEKRGCLPSLISPCFGSTREVGASAASWATKRASSLREFSEVVAGPKWKNFVRRFGGYLTNKKKKKKGIQYDSFDYKLNFDDGLKDEEEHERFSLRFAPPVSLLSLGS